MRLSEAIRLGSMLGPQAKGSLQQTRRRKYLFFGPVVTEYCALGAAFAASGAKLVPRIATTDLVGATYRGTSVIKAGQAYEGMEHNFDVLVTSASCPVCVGRTEELFRLIPHLNDDHQWTREAIADFVERIEQPESADAVARVDGVVAGGPRA